MVQKGRRTIPILIYVMLLPSITVFSNKSLMEKFVPIMDSASGSGGSLSYRCTKCRSVFNSNERVMEKHYFANHEFR